MERYDYKGSETHAGSSPVVPIFTELAVKNKVKDYITRETHIFWMCVFWVLEEGNSEDC